MMARYRGRHAAGKQVAGVVRQFGRRGKLRRSVVGTTVAAAAMAALTASQAPGVELGGYDRDDGADRSGSAPRDQAPGDDSYHTELPPLESPAPPGGSPGHAGIDTSESGIPATVLAAYKYAQRSLASSTPDCGVRWQLLAAIGKVESGQARGGAVTKDGTTLKPILGPVLNGSRFARIHDTDGGRWDGDSTYDRAVGPLQFIPSTWHRWGSDGNGDGRRDPGNVFDASLSAGRYLCGGGRDLAKKADLDRSILSYNDSAEYLRTVLAWYEFYSKGTHRVPDGSGALPTSPGAGGFGRVPGNGAPGTGGSDGSGSHRPGGGSHHKPGGDPGGKPGGGSGGGSGGGGDHQSPSPEPPPHSPSPSPSTPAAVKPVGDTALSAAAGEDFAEQPGVSVSGKTGKKLKGVRVRYEIRGDTGAHFTGTGLLGHSRRATVTTGEDGTATAPELNAGLKPGEFTVHATVVGHDVRGADFHGTVKEKPAPQPPKADKLERTSQAPLKAPVNGEFANDAVQIKATSGDRPAAGVPLTATMVKDAGDRVPNDKGPYFKGLTGNVLRTLNGLRTDRNGMLTLPKIYTDGNAGTFKLRISTAEGKQLVVDLTVTKGGEK
jgi:hypothetical protein